jgi:hypothetical protein
MKEVTANIKILDMNGLEVTAIEIDGMVFDKRKPGTIVYKPRCKYRRRKPSGKVGRSKKYGAWIPIDVYEAVKKEVAKFGVEATTGTITKSLQKNLSLIRATLDYMIGNDEIFAKKKGRKVTYHLKPTGTEQV